MGEDLEIIANGLSVPTMRLLRWRQLGKLWSARAFTCQDIRVSSVWAVITEYDNRMAYKQQICMLTVLESFWCLFYKDANPIGKDSCL